MAGEFKIRRNIAGSKVLLDKNIRFKVDGDMVLFICIIDREERLLHYKKPPVSQESVNVVNRRYVVTLGTVAEDTSHLEFHEKLKYHRQLNRLNQQEVVDMVGTSLRMYQRYERGETVPSATTFLAILKALKIKHSF